MEKKYNLKRGIYTDSSMSSDQDDVNSDEKNIQIFVKSMLQGRVFIGTFQEKRYVANIKAYRDVISINKDEQKLLFDLNIVYKRLQRYTDRWIGITTPEMIGAPSGYCLWVELPTEVFGSYWYQIKTVKFKEQEIYVKLKQIRTVNNADSSPKATRATRNYNIQQTESLQMNQSGTNNLNQSTNSSQSNFGRTNSTRRNVNQTNSGSSEQNQSNLSDSDSSENSVFNFSEIADSLKDFSKKRFSYIVDNILTVKNTKDVIIFCSVLVMTIFTGGIELIKFLGEFTLRLMHETTKFMHSVSPILIAMVNVVGKSIAGLYMLIAMLWTNKKDPVTVYQGPPPDRYLPIGFDNKYIRRGLPAPPINRNNFQNSGVRITPIYD